MQCERLAYDGPIALAVHSDRPGWQVFNNVIPAKGKEVRLYVVAPLDLFPERDVVYEKIEALIGQLGSDRYIERSEAERQLLTIGYEAFDQLKAAESHADPEIARQS